MTISQQTQSDLATILETLDQRIHELTEDPVASPAERERHLLSSLRNEVAILTK
ncbi:hypothetical protein SAMN04488077_1223 [Roseovarius tolerans]|uniref:Uncharacterized protein n=1 Tax=Roseovarius tolerans TaxID=74031 RepID=A0A1H8I061_9RHOB|nr:hypothetical protein SAMN04488077_1223 [Roseovarius tolerans]